jgi:hypothetical protein
MCSEFLSLRDRDVPALVVVTVHQMIPSGGKEDLDPARWMHAIIRQ